MKVLGLMMVRNGADRVTRTLDGMHGYCDEVYAIDDRAASTRHIACCGNTPW